MREKKIDINKLEKSLERTEKFSKFNDVMLYISLGLAGLLLLISRDNLGQALGLVSIAAVSKFFIYPQSIGRIKTQINEYYASNPSEVKDDEENNIKEESVNE